MYHEEKRILKLKNLNVLGKELEQNLDEVVKIASIIFEAPISLITLIDEDKQLFKSKLGVDISETPRNISFCTHTIVETEDHMVVNDLTKDDRFKANPFVVNQPNVKFYAGASIITDDGFKLGTVCILDTKPRKFSEEKLQILRILAQHTIKLINFNDKSKRQKIRTETLEKINKNLETFTYTVAHDVKGPLRTMKAFSEILMNKTNNNFNTEEIEYLTFIKDSADYLTDYTNSLLNYSKKIQIDTADYTYVKPQELIDKISLLTNLNNKLKVNYSGIENILASKPAIEQILQNLISNALKYRNVNKANCFVNIKVEELENHLQFTLADNGIGISEERQKQLFKIFSKDKRNANSYGLGLCIVKDLVDKMNGDLQVKSKLGEGTTILFTVAKR